MKQQYHNKLGACNLIINEVEEWVSKTCLIDIITGVYFTNLSQISYPWSVWTEMNIWKQQQLHSKKFGVKFDIVECQSCFYLDD